ncbi:asparaginyl-tRNA synthetase [Thozetella sp. PMI_491]|nr:asparaginyl-tRNA synthetase [Thozetella sp. PMI_491]
MRPATFFKAPKLGRLLASRPGWARRCLSQKVPASISGLLEWEPASPVDGVAVNGFVRSVRAMKSHRFVSLGDGSSVAPLQAVVPVDQADGLSVGAAVRLTGSWVSSPGRNQSHELHVSQVEVLGPSDAATFPIQKKYQTPEYLRTMPHLRSRTPYNAALLRLRSDAIASLNQFFASRLFTQTHPPIITSSDCEGGGEAFTISPAAQESESEEPFFRSPKYLTVSAQLHLEALAQAVGNVWTLSPAFRAERSDTSRHLSEFYMLEAEFGFVDDLGGVMDLTEDMLHHLSKSLYQTRGVQELLSRSNHGGSDLAPAEEVVRRWEGLQTESWPRLTYTEAIEILSARPELFEHKPSWGVGLQAEHERYIAGFVGGGKKPVFVVNYPRDIKPFYMLQSPLSRALPGDAGQSREGRLDATVECFDLLVPEFCEIAGGSMREHRLEQLLASMKQQDIGKNLSNYDSEQDPEATKGSLDWYVDLRRWGCPPHGGFGLGFDRLLGYLSGVQTIRDIVAFPRWFGRCDC